MIEQVKSVIAAVFNIDVSEIDLESSPDTIDAWDSLGHMNLVSALEDEFDLEIDEEMALEMMNVDLICEVLQELITKSE